jgi:uncharacterized protein (DUF305 family)
MSSRVPFWLAGTLAVVALVAGLLLAPLAPWAASTPGEQSAEAGFARDMRAHHAQAVAMSVLAFDRTQDPEVRAVAMDIATSQQAQIGTMGAWLEEWGLRPSGTELPMAWTGHPVPAGERMPGMASAEEMSELSQARGDAFDRMWAGLMHTHHSGGLPMTEAVIARTDREPVRALAEGMRNSQSAELSVLEQIASRAGGDVGARDAHAQHG